MCGSRACRNNNVALLSNAKVAIAADYYQMPDLLQFAVDKFCVSVEMKSFNVDGFAKIAQLIWTSFPHSTSLLKSKVIDMIVNNATELATDEAFTALAQTLPEILHEVFCHQAWHRVESVANGKKLLNDAREEINCLQEQLWDAEERLDVVKTYLNNPNDLPLL